LAHALLDWGVQKTEYFTRLLRLSATGKGFCFAASLLVFVTVPLHAGEPVMTLAMNEPSKNSSAASSLDSTPGADSSLLDLKTSQPKAVNTNDDKLVAWSPAGQMESQAGSVPPESLRLVRESSHPNKPVTVQAGYGRIWDDQSTLKKIACDHQETGCAYVCANFSF
jgi:hypothetical protein